MRVPPFLSKIVIPLSFGSVSGVAFAVSKLMRVFSSLSTAFFVLACFGVIIGVLLKGWKQYAMYALSAILLGFIILEQCSLLFSTSRAELYSDATETVVDYLSMLGTESDPDFPWLNKDNFVKEQIRCFIIPSKKFSDFTKSAFDKMAIIKDDPVNQTVGICILDLSQSIEKFSVKVKTKYRFALVYVPHLSGGRQIKGVIELPKSSYNAIKGTIYLDNYDWQKGKEFLEQANSEHNAAACYFLSKWYRSGYGDESNRERADSLLMEAVKKGSRAARYEWGTEVLKNSRVTMSDIMKSQAEDYLREAANLKNSITTETTANLARESIFTLNDFYRACGKERNSKKYYRKAYKFTKRNPGSYTDLEVRYVALLDNCISLGKYDEALEIIKEGQQRRHPHCYLALANMYSEGKGLGINYYYAERLLRFAADSLNHYPAYHGLALLYESREKEGVEFWNRLYDIEFSNKTE